MEAVLLAFVVCASNVFCFAFGVRVAQAAAKGEKVSIVPPLVIKDTESKKAEMDRNRIDTILRNIENFDGTGNGQEDVPGR